MWADVAIAKLRKTKYIQMTMNTTTQKLANCRFRNIYFYGESLVGLCEIQELKLRLTRNKGTLFTVALCERHKVMNPSFYVRAGSL